MAREADRNALARDIAERRTGMPAYLVDDETWAAAEAEADDILSRPAEPQQRRPLFDGSGCGHPPDPVAGRSREGLPVCHCGTLLEPRNGMHVEGAPGPVVSCQGCGCHVAVPLDPQDNREDGASNAS